MAWLHQGGPGQSGKQEVAVGGRARAGAPRAHALVPSSTRLKEAALGWATTAVGWANSAGPAQELGRLVVPG